MNRAAQIESRPKSVKNHGAPAARNCSPGTAVAVSRSESRSSRAWATQRSRRSSEEWTVGALQGAGALAPCTTAASSRTPNCHRAVAAPPAGIVRVKVRVIAASALMVASGASTEAVTESLDHDGLTVEKVELSPALIWSRSVRSGSTVTTTTASTGWSRREVIVRLSLTAEAEVTRRCSARTPGSTVASSWRAIDTKVTSAAVADTAARCSSGSPLTRIDCRRMTRTSEWYTPWMAALPMDPSAADHTCVGAVSTTVSSCSRGCSGAVIGPS